MEKLWDWLQLAFAAIGGFVGWFVGGLDGLIYALIAFTTADYVTGFLAAVVRKELSSETGAKGIVKKVTIYIIIGIGHLTDIYMLGGGSALRTALIFFYAANELVSLIENSAVIGLPIPKVLKDALVQIKCKSGEESETTGTSGQGDGEYIRSPHPEPVTPKENEMNQEEPENENLS